MEAKLPLINSIICLKISGSIFLSCIILIIFVSFSILAILKLLFCTIKILPFFNSDILII
jgi:hypothetical protein